MPKKPFFAQTNADIQSWLTSAFLLLIFCLTLLLIPSTAYGTEPIDLDPDPDFTSPMVTIVVQHAADLDIGSLPPGHYLIIVIDEEGRRYSYEIRL